MELLAPKLAMGVFAAIGIVSIWTPLSNEAIAERWFAGNNFLYLSALPIITALSGLLLLYALKKKREVLPFVLSLLIFLFSFIGLGVSQYPYIIPREVTLWEAAGPDSALGFLLIGASVLLPVILGYTAWSYWVFRGKVKLGEDLH